MNQTPTSHRRDWLVIAFCLVGIILLGGGMSAFIVSDASLDHALLLSNVMYHIEHNYPDQVDWDKLTKSARNAMFEGLDRYSRYFENNQFDRFDEQLSGSYTGIGITVVSHEQGLLLISVRENGPAAMAGLLSGDIITAADSVSLIGMSSEESIVHIRGEEGSKILVTVFRPSEGATFEAEVIRKKIDFEHIPFAGYTVDSMLYIRLLDFDAGAGADLEDALDSLMIADKRTPEGIILDLRGNPGGLFSEAFAVADLFLNEGIMIVGTDARSKWESETFYATGQDIAEGVPLAVLIDNGSASAAEIVAGALRQAGRAFLVGDTTFGKGLVQGFVRFPGGDGLKLTTSRYFFEGDLYLNDFDSTLSEEGTGLAPDYYIEMTRRDRFIRELENSLVLSEFSAQYEDSIVSRFEREGLNNAWLGPLLDYVEERSLVPGSNRSLMIEDFLFVATMEETANQDKIVTLSNQLLVLSKKMDRQMFATYSDYISQRLVQLAYQRKYGQYRQYKDVLLPFRPEIDYATMLLKEHAL